MRAKFVVESVTHFPNKSVTAKLVAVISNSEENKSFSKYTPYAKLDITITNPNATDFFFPGKEYYIDFTQVPSE